MDGLVNLESYILYESSKKNEEFYYIIVGDLNARCGLMPDYIIDDSRPIDHLPSSDWYTCDEFGVPRKSKDKVIRAFGKGLVDLCCNLSVHMLNDRTQSDPEGEFTF